MVVAVAAMARLGAGAVYWRKFAQLVRIVADEEMATSRFLARVAMTRFIMWITWGYADLVACGKLNLFKNKQ